MRKRNLPRINEGLYSLEQEGLTATLLGEDAEHMSIITIIRRSEERMDKNIEQAKVVRMLYDFLPESTWGMFFGEDPVAEINGEPADPYFSSIHFLIETMCHKLSSPAPRVIDCGAEVRVCTDYMRRCYQLATMQRCVRKIILMRRVLVAGNQWKQMWFTYGVRPLKMRC